MSDAILQVKHLSKSFGSHQVLKDIDFTVRPGDVTSIIGASGSGKSTLLRCINLLETPSAGDILFHGENITARGFNPCRYRSQVGMVFQSFNLFNNMTVLENCMVGQVKVLKKSKAEAKENAMKYLEQVGMAPYINARPRQISGGQRQRVAIARALATDPKVLLCDEATSALDPDTTRSILGLIREINQKMGITVVVITHQMSVVEAICDRVAILDGGQVVEEGTVQEIFAKPKTAAARRLVAPGGGKASRELASFAPDDHVIRLTFNGSSTEKPLVASLAAETGILVSVLSADTRDLNQKCFGSMLLRLPRDVAEARRAMEYIRTQPGVTVEEVTGL